MTIRLGGPLVGALVGLAAAGLGAVFIADGFDWRTLAVAAGAVVVASAAAFAANRSITPAPAPGTGAHSGGVPVDRPADGGAQAEADRAVLVEACIWMRDRATSPALASQLDQTFQRVGVAAIDATGQRFDPTAHEAGATVAAASPSEDGIIARTETPGYSDRGKLLRHPVVTVYRGQVRA
ncbi:nucleotide exchange factor GrpE [Glycomyces xiaoerkulensis]|uniref:nucleotide exchange factor GrpE n=1 Tax=Glycomyces xiaoerkulensis TaxID=2038139 RepID=UPI0012FFF120|nr:nucleotide exchange factor GrpE [Glycomyces xiaoerkulensis]